MRCLDRDMEPTYGYLLPLCKGAVESGTRAYDLLLGITRTENDVIQKLAGGVVLLVQKELVSTTHIQFSPSPEYTREFVQEDMEKGILLLLATKVNWWRENHHVGERVFSSFMKKVLTELFDDSAEDYINDQEIKQAIWVAGHWMDTRTVVTDMLSILKDHRPSSFNLDIPQYILSAMKSFPAGTGRYVLYHSILQSIFNSPYAVAAPRDVEIQKFLGTYESIQANPMRYHVGAAEVGLPKPINPGNPNQRVQMVCSAYIHATAPTSHLASSHAITPFQQIQGNMIYLRMLQIARKHQ